MASNALFRMQVKRGKLHGYRNPHRSKLHRPYLFSRGPPKGYIEAIESRMHRMEALLGGILNNDDPRAQALLEESVQPHLSFLPLVDLCSFSLADAGFPMSPKAGRKY